MVVFLLFWLAGSAYAEDFVIEKITGNASDIQLTRADGWKQVPTLGARVPQGTQVTTGPEAALSAKLPDGSTVVMGNDSDAGFHLLGSQRTEISVDHGRARATVPKAGTPKGPHKFLIKTKAATMGVRGTDFTVEVKDEQVGVHVLEGAVDVARAKLEKPDFVLAQNQALDLGAKPAPNEQPRAFEPAQFLAEWEKRIAPVELHWWQRLWRWVMGLWSE